MSVANRAHFGSCKVNSQLGTAVIQAQEAVVWTRVLMVEASKYVFSNLELVLHL